jgi:hypothetical protein
MNYEKVRNRPSQFESVTSVKVEEFDKLLPEFTNCLNRLEYPTSLPSAEHMLFFTLTYLKLNPLQEQHGASFDMS